MDESYSNSRQAIEIEVTNSNCAKTVGRTVYFCFPRQVFFYNDRFSTASNDPGFFRPRPEFQSAIFLSRLPETLW
jgi:hypothetical protein